ncbi:MAG: TlpA disulfide reductase family protein [Pseudomonadota bacterium]
MKRFNALIGALLYTALAATANPASSQALGEAELAKLAELREGDMRKLVIHDAPIPAGEAGFADLDGAEYTLADSNGQIRLVNFWATWCAPCRHEKPSLDRLEADLSGSDFHVIAIATGRNPPDAIKRFNEEVGIEALVTYVDPGSRVASEMRVPGLPVTVLIDRNGMEIGRLVGGADWTSDSARDIIAYLVGLPKA